MEEFFNNFEISAAGVAPEYILNYDETNVSNNPGAVKAIFKKGVKYSEQIRENSKTAISIMFCGSASGMLLPPYVVYKGANVNRLRMGLKGLSTLPPNLTGLTASVSLIFSSGWPFPTPSASLERN